MLKLMVNFNYYEQFKFILMKNFYILIVFIFGLIVGILGFAFMQNFTLNTEMKKVEAEELILEQNPVTKSVPVYNTPVIKETEKPVKPAEDHIFFAMFCALTVVCLLFAVCFGIDAYNGNRTKVPAIFFGVVTLASAFVAVMCY